MAMLAPMSAVSWMYQDFSGRLLCFSFMCFFHSRADHHHSWTNITSYAYSKVELTDVSRNLCFIFSEDITFLRVLTPFTTTTSIETLINNKLSKLAAFALADVLRINSNVEISGFLFSGRIEGGLHQPELQALILMVQHFYT